MIMNLGEQLKSRRKRLGLSRGYLSDLSGVSVRTLDLIECGGNPTLELLERVLLPLGLKIELSEVNPYD